MHSIAFRRPRSTPFMVERYSYLICDSFDFIVMFELFYCTQDILSVESAMVYRICDRGVYCLFIKFTIL